VIIGNLLIDILIAAPTAFARLAAVGPLNPGNGFPVYFVDTNGVALELPVKPSCHPKSNNWWHQRLACALAG
jgi:hypothetical protein